MGTLIGLLGGALVVGVLLWLIVALGPYFWIPALLLVTESPRLFRRLG